MKRSRFIGSQIIEAIKRVEAGLAVPELCQELGVSSATFYKWRSKCGGMDVPLMARVKELEAENTRLRKMYVEEKLKAEIVAEVLAKKWRGCLTAARWLNERCKSDEVYRSSWPAQHLALARPVSVSCQH